MTAGSARLLPTLDFEPRTQAERLTSAFVQDELQLVSDRLLLTGGTKFEHNIYTGLEVQPTGRLLWRARPTQSVWGGVTRAVRTPSRIERAIRSYNLATVTPVPIYIEVSGSDDFDAERVMTYTAGYRTLAAPRLYVEAVLYYNDHADLAGGEAAGDADRDLAHSRDPAVRPGERRRRREPRFRGGAGLAAVVVVAALRRLFVAAHRPALAPR